MRTSSWSIMALAGSVWPMLGKIPTALSSSSPPFRHHGWMGNMWSLAKFWRAWWVSYLTTWRGSQQTTLGKLFALTLLFISLTLVIFGSFWPISHCDPPLYCDNFTAYKNKVKHFLLTVGLSQTPHIAKVKIKWFLFVFVLGKHNGSLWTFGLCDPKAAQGLIIRLVFNNYSSRMSRWCSVWLRWMVCGTRLITNK